VLALLAAAGACVEAGSGFAHGELVLSNFGGGTPERHIKSLELVVSNWPATHLHTAAPNVELMSSRSSARLVTVPFLWQSYSAKGVKSGVINVGKAILASKISTRLATQCLGLTSVRQSTITAPRIPLRRV